MVYHNILFCISKYFRQYIHCIYIVCTLYVHVNICNIYTWYILMYDECTWWLLIYIGCIPIYIIYICYIHIIYKVYTWYIKGIWCPHLYGLYIPSKIEIVLISTYFIEYVVLSSISYYGNTTCK